MSLERQTSLFPGAHRNSGSCRPVHGAADHIGIDEAGRGCLAGPVVAAAVLFPAKTDFASCLPGLADSKKLTEKQRFGLVEPIQATAFAWGIGLAWQEEIDRVNILAATFRAMSRAVLALVARLTESRGPVAALPRLCIDGNQIIPLAHWRACCRKAPPESPLRDHHLLVPMPLRVNVPELPEQEAVVRGDMTVPSVSAASVLAKTARDRLMSRLDELYPGYGLARHKGYGTREHREILACRGPCPLHRKTFRQVRTERTIRLHEQGSLG